MAVCVVLSIQDRQVSELAKDLANKLGLKIRKAYVSPQVCNLYSFSMVFVRKRLKGSARF